mgnify:CR=1 FL=1
MGLVALARGGEHGDRDVVLSGEMAQCREVLRQARAAVGEAGAEIGAGEVAAGVGFGSSPRELFFRVALLPSASQVGSAPTIVGEASAEGEDRFTDISVKSNLRSAQTTSSLSDAGAEAKSGAVTR